MVVILAGCVQPVETSQSPPDWEVGDWWTYEYVLTPRDGLTDIFTIVVAAETDTHYLVGMPSDHFSDLAIIYHTPPTGEVRKGDLMWETHDGPLNWLKFPLVEGDSWDTQWWGTPGLTTTVASVNDTHAVTQIEARGNTFSHTYSFNAENLERWPALTDAQAASANFDLRLIDYGHNYRGAVTVPEGQDLTIYHGTGNLIEAQRLSQGLLGTPYQLPRETITVGEYDAMTVAILLGNTGAQELPMASTCMDVILPDGAGKSMCLGYGQPSSILLWHQENPAGDWRYEAMTAGGYAILEAIAYNEVEYVL